MASNKADNFNNGRRRKRSTSRPNFTSRNHDKIQSSRSHSVEHTEKKVLNSENKYDIFFSVSQAFENILRQFFDEIDENYEKYEPVNEKLVEIQNLIREKINFLDVRLNQKNVVKLDLNSKLLGSSLQSLVSEVSETDNFFDADPNFFSKINCPFCSKPQDDDITLVKHLDENCEPHTKCVFEKSKHVPYSVFQILPNNMFKCNVCPNSTQRNIKHYITHSSSEKHVSAYTRAAQSKFYSHDLFCSCCKIKVANTYTQFSYHIKHSIHKNRSNKTPNIESFLQKGIACVYFKNKRFKCLVCHPHFWCDSSKQLLEHLEGKNHIKNNLNQLLQFYCEFCSKASHIYEIISHSKQKEHKKNVEECRENVLEEAFEICFYCGFVGNDLTTLSKHMKSKCPKINDIRKKYLKSAKPEEKDLTESKATDNNKVGVVEEKDLEETEVTDNSKVGVVEEEYYVIVKDDLRIPELFKYFTKFGEVTGIETYKDSDVKIRFREEKTVEDILLLRNVLQIDGVKLEVTTDCKLSKSKETTKEANNSGETSSRYEKTKDESVSDECDDSYVSEDPALKNLFQSVSSHLRKNVQTTDFQLHEKLSKDIISGLIYNTCEVVGFSGCRLAFSVEGISFYCKKSSKFEFLNSDETSELKNILRTMCNSQLWEDVNITLDRPFSFIKCVHKETQKACTITLTESAVTLTKMLRDCTDYNSNIYRFCLIIRFWLSVHELKIKDYEYTIISLMVFFVMQQTLNFPFYKYSSPTTEFLSKIVEGSVEFAKPTLPLPNRTVQDDVKKLFEKFLLFLEKFDFDKNAICLPLKYPVPKALIRSRLNLLNSEQELKSSLCILTPFSFNKNLAREVTEDDLNSLLKIVRDTIKHYKIK